MKPDIDKVIKGMTYCIIRRTDACSVCPYVQDYDRGCDTRLHKDALELLNALRPRLLTLEEACGADECWLERKGFPVTVADVVLADRQDMDIETRELNTLREYVMSSAHYGMYWRAWSARPTKEQMEAVPWAI